MSWTFDRTSLSALAGALLLLAGATTSVSAQVEEVEALDAVVGVHAEIPGTARTAESLGTTREGTGVVIDSGGLVVTIGYVILEAERVEIRQAGDATVPASIVAYDHESGLGLLRAGAPLRVEPATLGDSDAVDEMQPLLAVSEVGELEPLGVYAVDRRDFAGYWEYLLEEAIFTSPPHHQFGGAALFDENGALVGIGSLFVNDAVRRSQPVPGNMFIPINELKPILADLIAAGRRSGAPRPWLGLYLEEYRGRLFVTRLAADGPAQQAGILPGDLIIGIDSKPVGALADFYRQIWGLGDAGVAVVLDVLKGTEVRTTTVQSGDRYDWLRLDPSL